MLLYILTIAAVCLSSIALVRRREWVPVFASLFFIALVGVVVCAAVEMGTTHWGFFTFDKLGVTYLGLMALVGLLVVWRSVRYLDSESLRHLKIYYGSLVLLGLTLVGVYLSNNLAVTWIFLEATTLATAGLTYHRRTGRALEATWKYLFVSSVGIAIAYLGVLLLATASPETLSYAGICQAVAAGGNPLYLRLAFLFILVGYSTKLELFPLFTVGVDANHASPAPSSAFISSALVGGGFVALLRVYKVMEHSSEIVWVRGVLALVAVLSIVAAAVYLGRTGNYKRLLAYSTVENGGIMMLGLALGGVGVVAAVLHSLGHTLVKAVLYLQMSIVGRVEGSYRVGRVGGYWAGDRVGGVVLLFGTLALVALPPSLLFRSEFLIFSGLVDTSKWWLVVVVALPLLACLYWLGVKLLSVLYRAIDTSSMRWKERDVTLSLVLLGVLTALFFFGATHSAILRTWVEAMIG